MTTSLAVTSTWNVQVTARVLNGSGAVSGAGVRFSIASPTGSIAYDTATTGSTGMASIDYRLKPHAPDGIYSVVALATYGSLSAASGAVTFIKTQDEIAIGTAAATTLTYTLSSSPQGRTVTVDGVNYTAPVSFNWPAGSTHTIGVSSPQAGSSGTQYVFGNWSDGGAQSHTITAPSSSATWTANFQTRYYVTTAATSGGSISPASGYYAAGSTVQVGASASSGYAFAGFSGALTGIATPQALSITGPKSVTANFSTTAISDAKLLFKSGFEGGLSLNAPYNCGSTHCYQTLTGTDSSSGFAWPPNIWGSSGTWSQGGYFQLYAGTSVTTSSIYTYVENQLQSLTGRTGTTTSAVYQDTSGSEYAGRTSRQDPYVITPDVTATQTDLYSRVWIKFQPDLKTQLLSGQFSDGTWGDWRVIAEWKTGGQAYGGTTGCVPNAPTYGGDYRVINYVLKDSSGNLFWRVQGDNNANGNLPYTVFWRVDNKTLPVPVGQWFKFEWFWHRSAGSDGRVWVAVNGQVIADQRGANVGSYGCPINRIVPFTVYTGGYFPAYQWVDDLELWDGFPADAAAH